MTLVLHDLLPRFGGGYRGARPGAIAAAVERIILEKMLSVGLTAQARMMCNGPAEAAAGWSAAEDGVYKAARALNLLAQASARIAKTYAEDTRFNDDRAYGEITPEPRLETLAQQAIYSTDRHTLKDVADRRFGEEAFQDQVWKHVHENARRHHAYLDATIERLRRYEPNWLNYEQHQAALEAAAEAGKTAPAQREPDEAAHPDRDRTNAEKLRADAAAMNKLAIEKTQKRVVVEKAGQPPISGAAPPAPAAPPALAEPPPPKKRGAQPGNVLSLKTGRHTASARAERAEDSAMLKEVRAFCAEVDGIAEELEAATARPG
ncbi:MAG: hypothetical protein QM698_06195 [Micropepsaceae bacterium]